MCWKSSAEWRNLSSRPSCLRLAQLGSMRQVTQPFWLLSLPVPWSVGLDDPHSTVVVPSAACRHLVVLSFGAQGDLNTLPPCGRVGLITHSSQWSVSGSDRFCSFWPMQLQDPLKVSLPLPWQSGGSSEAWAWRKDRGPEAPGFMLDMRMSKK